MSSDTAPAATRASPPPRPSREEAEEAKAYTQFARLKKLVNVQTWVMGGLALFFVLMMPFMQPVYLYYARSPDDKAMQIVGLDMPNMTDRAVLSWATTSITEIMTMGFGDMDVKLPKQRWRFTGTGWDAYSAAFVRQKIGETFKHNQLVLTTVPSNTPVIVAQGINPDGVYQWLLQMPVIMTYATNDNITSKQRAVVTLSVIRVSAEDSSSGIAIDKWSLE